MGLLDLPGGVLDFILSLLDPLGLAAVRLTCRALYKTATAGRQRVTIQFQGCYSATAIASPRVLQSMHTFHLQLDNLDAEEEAAAAAGDADRSWYSQTRRWLRAQLLERVAHEVVSLSLECALVEDQPGEAQLEKPHRLVARVDRLESLSMQPGWKKAVIHELPALRHLKRLVLATSPLESEIQLMCRLSSLTELQIGEGSADVEEGLLPLVFGHQAAGRIADLHKLGLTLSHDSVRSLNELTTLTSLTSLHVGILHGRPVDLNGLARLTGLKSLQMKIFEFCGSTEEIADTLAPLSLLTGLTLLDFMDYESSYCRVPLDVSVLSSLTAL